jgi:uncharacterized membrane protein YphA (DoxX/SURF4 family)
VGNMERKDAAELPAGPTCARSSLSPGLRLAIAFGVLFGLKWALPLLPLSASAQIVVLLLAASFFIWRFWWHCSPNRRGALLMAGVLWAAGALKLALQ